MKKIALLLFIILLGGASGAGLYVSEKNKADPLTKQLTATQLQLKQVQSAYSNVKQANIIKTDSWKQYCDPIAPFCFKYPMDWKLSGGPVDIIGDQRTFVTVTNPTKTAIISYTDPLVKDGSDGSAHIADILQLNVGGATLKLVGSFPVSSDTYAPSYVIVNQDSLAGGEVGSIGHDQSSSLFTVGDDNALSLSGYYSGSQKLTSQAQAEAWFKSIDGKTVKTILSSFATK